MPGEEDLSRRERQIMDVVYVRGEVTAAQVVAALADPPSKTAVRTLMTILERKGYLTHREQDHTYVYVPTKPRQQAAKSALRRVLQTFFGGSLEQAVAAHLADDESHLEKDELTRLAKLIQQAKKEGR
jgi:BlaI family transcriptional regulator, penicillinase repressor